MQVNPKHENRKYHYTSLADIKNICKSDMPNQTNRDFWLRIEKRNTEREGNDASSWFGPKLTDYQLFQNALNQGWGYGLKRVNEMSAKIKLPKLESVKRKTFKGREGDFLDIHKVNRGEFDRAWSRRKRASKVSKKKFTLAIHIGANCDVNADKMFWRGIATVSLAKALSTAGHSVEIVAYSASTGLVLKAKDKRFYTIIIKPFDMPINISSLVSTVCLAGFFRTQMFKVFLTDPEICDQGLGSALKEHLPDSILKRNGQTINIPDHLSTDYKVEEWLNTTVNKI